MASRFAAQLGRPAGASFLHGVGRLQAGRRRSRRRRRSSRRSRRGSRQQYPRNRSRGVLVRPYQDVLVKDYRLGLIVLLSAVAAVLLIACANIANLLLARGTARRREIAVRTALGASRGRIVRQFLCEGLVLAALGGVGGTVLALWGVDALVRVSPVQIPRLHTVQVDRSVLAFTTARVDAHRASCAGWCRPSSCHAPDPGDALKDGDRGGSGARGARTRQALVVAEMAISLVLLAAAGLLVRSLVTLQRVNPGFVDRTRAVDAAGAAAARATPMRPRCADSTGGCATRRGRCRA